MPRIFRALASKRGSIRLASNVEIAKPRATTIIWMPVHSLTRTACAQAKARAVAIERSMSKPLRRQRYNGPMDIWFGRSNNGLSKGDVTVVETGTVDVFSGNIRADRRLTSLAIRDQNCRCSHVMNGTGALSIRMSRLLVDKQPLTSGSRSQRKRQ